MTTQVVTALTQKGQMTLPKAARQQLGVKPGDEVTVVVAPDGIRVERSLTTAEVRALTKTKVTWPGDAAADRRVAEGVAREYRQRHSSA